MATKINLRVESDFTQASADFKEFIGLSDKAEKSAKEFQEAFDTKHINNFLERQKRLGIAIKATSGETQANKAEYSKLRREIERLIMKGMDPLDDKMKPLVSRFQQLEAEMKDSTNATKGATKGFSLLDGVMLGLGAKALQVAQQGFQKVIEFTKESATAAADAEETYSKFITVFKDIDFEAEAVAQTLSNSFGIASSTAQKLVGDVGDILTGLGFTQESALDLAQKVSTLGIDLASFTNFAGGAEGAAQALTKALLGEAESVKALGIVIRQDTAEYKALVSGIMEAQGVTLTQAKALAALEIATTQSKNAIGDYARTADSAVNVQRRLEEQTKQLKENYGNLVLEGLTPVRRAFEGVVKSINDAIRIQKTLDELESGEFTGDYRNALKDLNDQLKIEESLLASGQVKTKTRINDLKAQIAEVERLAEEQRKANRTIEINARLEAERQKVINDAYDEVLKIKDEAFQRSEELRIAAEKEANANLTAAEIQRKIVNDQVNNLVELRDVFEEGTEKRIELENAIIELAKERSALDSQIAKEAKINAEEEKKRIEEEKKAIEDKLKTQRKELEVYFEKNSIAQEWHDAELERIFKEDEARADAAEKEKQRLEELRALRFEYANATLGLLSAISDFQSSQSAAEIQRIEEENNAKLEAADAAGASETELAELEKSLNEDLDKQKKKIARDEAKRQKKLALFEVAINTASAIVEALPNVFLAALAGATGAIQAAAIASQPIPSAQTGTGTPITVPDSARGRNDNVAVMASPGEQVSVTPRGGTGMMQNISVSLEGAVLISYINRKIESGEIRITTDNIQGGIAV